MKEEILKELQRLSEKDFVDFEIKLTPTLKKENVLGIRVPKIREYAKKIYKDPRKEEFLNSLPHKYLEENILHGILISLEKDFDLALKEVESYLPHVDNWMTCDLLSPKIYKTHTKELLPYIKKWINSDEEYTIRYGIEMLMSFYLDEFFQKEYLDLVAQVKSDAHYVKMMIAWFFATSLTKQYDSTIIYIENKKLERWTHNKTIQKSIESYRITDEKKDYLRSLKIKEKL